MLNVKKTLTKVLEKITAHDTKLTEIDDYVVEHGTNGAWTYRKWANGTYEAEYTGGFALNAGSLWQGGYYHETTYGIALPSFATSWRLDSAMKNDFILMYCVGAATRSDGLHLSWVNGSAGAVSGTDFGASIVKISGNWAS